MGNDVIMTSFLKIAQQFLCEYFLLIPIDVPSFKLIEGQIKELQGVVPNTPGAENDQKSPGRIGLSQKKISINQYIIKKLTIWRNRIYNLFCKILKFHDFKGSRKIISPYFSEI